MEPVSVERGVSWLPAMSTIGRLRKRLAEPLELVEGEHDRGVGGPNGVEQVARHHDGVGTRRDDAVYRDAEGVGDVGLALIDAGRSLPMVLPNAEVRIGDVGQFHSGNVSSPAD